MKHDETKTDKLNSLPEELKQQILGYGTPESGQNKGLIVVKESKHGENSKDSNKGKEAYKSNNFIVIKNCVYAYGKDGGKTQISNFKATPKTLVMVDDDSGELATEIVLDGVYMTGRRLKEVNLEIDKAYKLNWINSEWYGGCNINYPANKNKELFKAYIIEQVDGIPEMTIYKHTGFRKINNKYVYLHSDGAVGKDDITCRLETPLQDYRFIENAENISEFEAIDEVMNLFKITPEKVGYPLLAFTYLAPLNSMLTKQGIAPSFLLYLVGETGSFKTTFGNLFLSSFREYIGMEQKAPTSFESTGNYIEKLAFELKDSLLLVDDYFPATIQQKKKMDSIMQKLSRGMARGRLRSDTTTQKSFETRCLTMITGEDLPDIGESGLARNFIVKFEKDEVNKKDLSKRQDNAYKNNIAMRNYVEWLCVHYSSIQVGIKKLHNKVKSEFDGIKAHNRLTPIVSSLMLSLETYVFYLIDIGYFTKSQGQNFLNEAKKRFIMTGEEQAKIQEQEKPTTIFKSELKDLLDTNVLKLVRCGGGTEAPESDERFAGYDDEGFYLLIASKVYKEVKKSCLDSGRPFPIGQKELFERLVKSGDVDAPEKQYQKLVNRSGIIKRRYVHLRKSTLEFEEEE